MLDWFDWVLDPVLLMIVLSPLCLVGAGLFGGLWSMARDDAGEPALISAFTASERKRWRYMKAVFATHSGGPGERWRKWQRRCIFGFAGATIAWMVIAAITLA